MAKNTERPGAVEVSAVPILAAPEEKILTRREQLSLELADVQHQIAALHQRERQITRELDGIIETESVEPSPAQTTSDIQAYLSRQQEVRQERKDRIDRLAALDILPEDLQARAPIDRNRRRVSRFAGVR